MTCSFFGSCRVNPCSHHDPSGKLFRLLTTEAFVNTVHIATRRDATPTPCNSTAVWMKLFVMAFVQHSSVKALVRITTDDRVGSSRVDVNRPLHPNDSRISSKFIMLSECLIGSLRWKQSEQRLLHKIRVACCSCMSGINWSTRGQTKLRTYTSGNGNMRISISIQCLRNEYGFLATAIYAVLKFSADCNLALRSISMFFATDLAFAWRLQHVYNMYTTLYLASLLKTSLQHAVKKTHLPNLFVDVRNSNELVWKHLDISRCCVDKSVGGVFSRTCCEQFDELETSCKLCWWLADSTCLQLVNYQSAQ